MATGIIDQALDYLADKSQTIHAAPSITLTTGTLGSTRRVDIYGNVASLLITGKNSSSTSAGANVIEGTIEQAYRPAYTAYGIATYSNMMAAITITPEGTVRIRMANGTLPANTEIWGSVTYILP